MFVLLLGVFAYHSNAQNPPGVFVEGNQIYCGIEPMPVVTNVSINGGDADNTLDEIFIQISTGYSLGADQLSLTGVHPNITSSWAVESGLLTLTGPASYSEFEAAILDVRFQTTESNFTQDKFFSINLGQASYLPATGHYYMYVANEGVTWTEAKELAEQQNYFGLQGYLATITTPEEVQLTGEQAQGTGWIGGTDRQVEGVWRWETGPEAGQIFWNGSVDGSAPDGMFEFWNDGEPNNLGPEHYAHVTDPEVGLLGSWNDLADGGSESAGPYHPKGYIVEFGGMPGESNINVSSSSVIIMPQTIITKNSLCDEGLAEIALVTNVDEVLWYDSETSSEVINTGLTYNEYISENKTFYALPLFEGCTTGNRIPITVNVFSSPIANDITILQCDDEVLDGISSFNLSEYTDDIVRDENGVVIPIWNIEFYFDEALVFQLNANNFTNTHNNQVIYAKVFDNFTGCVSVSEVTLQVSSSEGVSATLEVCDDFVTDGLTYFNLNDADSQILEGSPINATLTYHETYNEALLKINEIDYEYLNAEPYNQIVYARVDIGDVCYAINELQLIVKELPSVNQYQEVYYCLNSFPQTIALNGGIIDDIPNNFYYNWSTGETTIDININELGDYIVLVTRPDGCTNQRLIRVYPSSEAVVETVDIIDVSDNNMITVLVSGEGEYVYALNDENGPYQASNNFENLEPGVHKVFIKDIKGDCGIISKDISVLGYPKFFTPNGDTENDTWEIKGFSTQFPVSSAVQIFDRYGKIITTLNRNNPRWDGTYNGALLPTDDYWFIAELQDGRTFKGHFTLKR